MRNYVERAKDFIKQVFPYINECDDPWEVRERIDCFNFEHDRKVKVGNGLSRIALITSDYVVKWDYDPSEVESIGGCADEVELYSVAEQEGYGYLFAEITHVTYQNRDFYVMPRINGIGRDDFNYAEDYMSAEEKAWCSRHHLSDLHGNNYGFRKGHVCIVDYACRDCYSSD